jgi:hypothetical protein
MFASTTHAEAFCGEAFPAGIDTHWEKENRTIWNEREHASEERELVYEISWISELGVWRGFLRSQRRVKTSASARLARRHCGPKCKVL